MIELKEKFIGLRLSVSEKTEMQNKAQNYKSLSDYIRYKLNIN